MVHADSYERIYMYMCMELAALDKWLMSRLVLELSYYWRNSMLLLTRHSGVKA
jgi:hypothetical protein